MKRLEEGKENPGARQLAFEVLRAVQRGAFADVALDRTLRQQGTGAILLEHRLVTELVYGSIRRQRTLDALIDQFATKKAHQQPPELRLIFHLGLYQLRYLSHIPVSAAVDTTVKLAKQNGFSGLSGFVNGLLRQYVRSAATVDPLLLPADPAAGLAIQHSYPDWIVQIWIEQFGFETAEKLCQYLNRPPHLDLRINPLRTTLEAAEAYLQAAGVAVRRVLPLPQALRILSSPGPIQALPGFAEGDWMVQDSSAQLVSHLLDPRPGDTVIDACAAPGGKTTHLAELMTDRGTVWACDRHSSRIRKVQENATRLQLDSIRTVTADSRQLTQFTGQADRVLLDAPCSGLGTLHRHADARWRQTPETVQELAQLQLELLNHSATWVKPGGVLVYATCTLHPQENEAIVTDFLAHHQNWQIQPPSGELFAAWQNSTGYLKLLPHQEEMDGFFMVRLCRFKD